MPGQRKVIDYLKQHSTDISTPEKLQAWIKQNPEKCGNPANRRMSLDDMIEAAETDFQKNGTAPKGKDLADRKDR